MADLSIQIHADGPADLQTSDAATVDALRRAYPVTPALVGVRELALVLRVAGQGLWADRLDALEEAHMVTLTISR